MYYFVNRISLLPIIKNFGNDLHSALDYLYNQPEDKNIYVLYKHNNSIITKIYYKVNNIIKESDGKNENIITQQFTKELDMDVLNSIYSDGISIYKIDSDCITNILSTTDSSNDDSSSVTSYIKPTKNDNNSESSTIYPIFRNNKENSDDKSTSELIKKLHKKSANFFEKQIESETESEKSLSEIIKKSKNKKCKLFDDDSSDSSTLSQEIVKMIKNKNDNSSDYQNILELSRIIQECISKNKMNEKNN